MKKTDSREKLRAFIAFELSEEIIAAIKTVQADLKACDFNVRWTRPESIHLSLKFLGDIYAEDVDRIEDIMTARAKNQKAITLAAKGIGVFPNMKRPRVIWVGIAGQTDSLVEFQNHLETDLELIGFQKEDRLFTGHLTLGRIKGAIDKTRFREVLKKFESFESKPFTAKEVILFRSELKPSGSVYTKMKTVRLE